MTEQLAASLAAAVQKRAAALLDRPDDRAPQDPRFVKGCLDSNERGDGLLYATLQRGRHLYNVTPKDGEWYVWAGHVWQRDDFRRALNAVEDVAGEYAGAVAALNEQIKADGIDATDKKHPIVALRNRYLQRIERLRSANGAQKALTWAPVVEPAMAVREGDFDQQPMLLPVANGVIDLKTGALVSGRPDDLLTRALPLDYDPHADCPRFKAFVREIADSDEVAAFLKRSFGYAMTGCSHEQYIWVFVGPGRNGKGVLFSLIGDILGPYYHEISRAMLVEQRNEPGPNAASEHKYSLLGKRLIVGAETNQGQKIDAAAIKGLTGEDRIVCRPLFKSEIVFKPSHTLMLHTNHIPAGLTRDFALRERLLKIDFPFMYVDDIAEAEKKEPAKTGLFRQKDRDLKAILAAEKPGILRWLVEGCLEWQQIGLAPPAVVLSAVDELAREEDKFGQFVDECCELDATSRIPYADIYDAFSWWWEENLDARENRVWSKQSVSRILTDRGFAQELGAGAIKMRRGLRLLPAIYNMIVDWRDSKKGRRVT